MFAELVGRSCFSFLQGASQPEEMVEQAARLQLGGFVLCDRDGLYGAVRGFSKFKEIQNAGKDERSNPSFGYQLGAELTLSEFRDQDFWRIVLLVQNKAGYQNLCRILTLGNAGKKGEFSCDATLLRAHESGLFALLVPPRIQQESETLDPWVARIKDAFLGRLAVVIYRHLDGYDRGRQAAVERLSRLYQLPIVASARPFYHLPERKPLLDVLYCIRKGVTLDEAGAQIAGNTEQMLRSESEMLRIFRDHPEWVHQSGEIFKTLSFSLSELKYHFPCQLEPGETADERLEKLTWEGVKRRYPGGISQKVHDQLHKELRLIQKLEVAPYFLSVYDIVEIARSRKILCQGRGSAANSAVCYMLGITAVDPARSSLLFERFLSQERAEPPDIDIDFEHERREEVIQEIYARYGRDQAAMVSEVICYRGKSALREVGKTFGLSLEQVGRLSGTLGYWDEGVTDERIQSAGLDIEDARVAQVVALSRMLQGFPRHLSIHVGGFVLSSRPLSEVAPVEPARMAERTVIPWDKDDIDTLGFFKVDVLGLGMLSAIRKALESVVRDGGLPPLGTALSTDSKAKAALDPTEIITRIPQEDPATYDMICRADTVGVFQIESRAQMSMLPRLQPRKFYDLVIEVALVRPGPIQGGMVHPYLRRRSQKERAEYPHPDLFPILERTLGVPLFQEQVMQLAIVGAGYTGGEADQLRRDMAAWKKHGRLLQHREKLLQGFRKKGISDQFALALFEQIKGFGEYGFPESHASSFALLVYSSSWLKAHCPAHFTCAVLNSQPMGFYSPSSLIQDAQKHGVRVEDVCVLRSSWDSTLEEPSEAEEEKAAQLSEDAPPIWSIEGRHVPHENLHRMASTSVGAKKKLRLGLRLVQGLSREGALRIEETRARGKVQSLEEFLKAARLRKNEVEALAKAGAFEILEPGRRQALWKTRAADAPGLFEHIGSLEPEVRLPELRPVQQLMLDYEQKGLCLEDHPLRYYRNKLQKMGAVRAQDLRFLPKNSWVKVAGWVINRQRPGTASGVVFMTLEDETGVSNLIFKSEVFDAFEPVARHSDLLLVEGSLERDRPLGDGGVAVIHVLVHRVFDLRTEVPRAATGPHKKRTKPSVPLLKLSRNFR
jgi:error-prone DNA polymerase